MGKLRPVVQSALGMKSGLRLAGRAAYAHVDMPPPDCNILGDADFSLSLAESREVSDDIKGRNNIAVSIIYKDPVPLLSLVLNLLFVPLQK